MLVAVKLDFKYEQISKQGNFNLFTGKCYSLKHVICQNFKFAKIKKKVKPKQLKNPKTLQTRE